MSLSGPQEQLSAQEQQERFQITFTALAGCLSLVMSAALPFITFALLASLASVLMLSLNHYKEAANLAYQPSNESLDTPAKVMLFSAIIVLGIFFLQLNPFSQVILATAFGVGLAAFFIHECVLASQDALNAALKTACQGSQLEPVRHLIAKGACVFAIDENGNNAFHHALENNEPNQEIIQCLQEAALKSATTRQDVVERSKALFSDEVTQQWQQVYQMMKQCIQSNTRENRAQFYEGVNNLINAYHEPLKNVINTFTHYLRDKLNAPYSRDSRNPQVGKSSANLQQAQDEILPTPTSVAPILQQGHRQSRRTTPHLTVAPVTKSLVRKKTR